MYKQISRSRSRDDLVAVLTAEHRHIDGLYSRYRGLAHGNPAERRIAAYTVAEQLRIHIDTERRYVDTALRAHFPAGADLAGHLERERGEIEHILYTVELPGIDDGEFGARFAESAEWFRRHVSETESGLFPRLNRLCDAQWLHAAGTRILAESL